MIIVRMIFLVGASFAWGSDDEWIVISDDDKCEDRVASREERIGNRELLVPLLCDEEQRAIREAEVAGGGVRCSWQRDVEEICTETLRCCALVGKYMSRCCSCLEER